MIHNIFLKSPLSAIKSKSFIMHGLLMNFHSRVPAITPFMPHCTVISLILKPAKNFWGMHVYTIWAGMAMIGAVT